MKQDLRKVNKCVWHCAATNPSQDYGLKEIDAMHEKRGFYSKEDDIHCGYHILIKRDGSAVKGRSLTTVGAHVYGHNVNSIGICWIGGVDENNKPEDNRTQAQRTTMRRLREVIDVIFPGIEHVGHRDLSPDVDGDGIIEPWEFLKACPCFNVQTEFYL